MTLLNARSIVRADGSRVQPTVRSLAGASATKAQRRRADRLSKVIGAGEPASVKKVTRKRTLSAARSQRLMQQKRSS